MTLYANTLKKHIEKKVIAMKKRIALILCIIMMVSVFSGCSLVIGGLAIVLPHLRPEDPTQSTMPVDPWAEYECITIAEALALCEQEGIASTS